VVDKPLIQYAVEECIASGIESIIFVTGRRKNAIEDHFDSAPELERFLEEKGKSREAEMVREISGGLHFSYTRQCEARGLGHAVFCARELVGDEPFAVLLGDVIMDGCRSRDALPDGSVGCHGPGRYRSGGSRESAGSPLRHHRGESGESSRAGATGFCA